jgi:hypothetical protein
VPYCLTLKDEDRNLIIYAREVKIARNGNKNIKLCLLLCSDNPAENSQQPLRQGFPRL